MADTCKIDRTTRRASPEPSRMYPRKPHSTTKTRTVHGLETRTGQSTIGEQNWRWHDDGQHSAARQDELKIPDLLGLLLPRPVRLPAADRALLAARSAAKIAKNAANPVEGGRVSYVGGGERESRRAVRRGSSSGRPRSRGWRWSDGGRGKWRKGVRNSSAVVQLAVTAGVDTCLA